jgi:hypothetical protein
MCLKDEMKVDRSRQARLSSEEDNSKANPSSKSEEKIGFIHRQQEGNESKVTQGEGWRTAVANPAHSAP